MTQTQNIEQQIRLLSTLQIAFAVAAIVFLIVAIILFIYLKIPQVFNEYRGKSAQKEMAQMAAGNSESRRMHNVNKKRHYTENLTDELSEKLAQQKETGNSFASDNSANETEVMSVHEAEGTEATGILEQESGAGETEVLDAGMQETEVLSAGEQETELLDSGEKETEVLYRVTDETEVLPSDSPEQTEPKDKGTMVLDASMLQSMKDRFEVEQSIILLHTDKVI